MPYLILVLLCALVPAFFLEILIFKGTAFLFRKGRLSWRSAATAMLVSAPFAICLSILSRFNAERPAILATLLLSILAVILLPAVIVKRSLHVKTYVSIAIVVVATLFCSVGGAAYGFVTRVFFLQAFRIPHEGMAPTLTSGDYIFVNKLVYRLGAPGRGEIVVFRYPVDARYDFIQRVVAIGGDIVEIRDKQLFVNGQRYAKDPGVNLDRETVPGTKNPRDNLPPTTVPAHAFFLLGDNRDHSFDSRFWGFVKLEHIIGRPFLIYWSCDAKTGSIRTDRMGERVR